MKVLCFSFGEIGTNCYIAFDEKTRQTALIDIADNVPQRYFEKIEELKLKVEYILLTHAHYDHSLGVKAAKINFPNAKICISKADYDEVLNNAPYPFANKSDLPEPDIFLNNGDTIKLGSENVRVISTPGHTRGGVSFYTNEFFFTGDTLFCGSYGRTDFHTGNFADIKRSIIKILDISGDRKILPGHGSFSTQQIERNGNPCIAGY